MPSPSPLPLLELIIEERDSVRRFPLHLVAVLGRDQACDIVLADPEVSRHHCRIDVTPQGARVTDLASSRGTRVDGREVSRVALEIGDVIELSASTRVTLTARDEAASMEPRVGGLPQAKRSSGETSSKATAPAERARPMPGKAPEKNESFALREKSAGKSKPAPAETRAESLSPRPAPEADAAEVAKPPEPIAKRKSHPPSPARHAAPRSKGNGAKIVVMSVLGVGLLGLLFLAFRGDGGQAAAAELFQSAKAARGIQKFDVAASTLETLIHDYPQTKSAGPAAAELKEVRQLAIERADMVAAFDGVFAQPLAVPLVEIVETLETVKRRFHPDVLAREEWDTQLTRAKGRADTYAQNVVMGAKSAVLAHLSGGDFGAALSRVDEADASVHIYGDHRTALTTLRERIFSEMRQAAGDLTLKASKEAPAEGAALLLREVARFVGTPVEAELRTRAEVLKAGIVAAPAVAQGADSGAGAKKVPAAPPPSWATRFGEAEALASRRRYSEALPILQELSAAGSGEAQVSAQKRIARIQPMATMVAAIVRSVKSDPSAFKGLELGDGTKADILSASLEGFELALGRKARIRWDWARITPERLEGLVARAALDGEAAMGAAICFLERRDRGRALKQLASRFDREPALRQHYESLAAEARGLAAVPNGGFVVFDHQLVSLAEKNELVAAKEREQLKGQVLAAVHPEWRAPLQRLKDGGEIGTAVAKAALEQRLASLPARLEDVDALRPKAVNSMKSKLIEEIEKRRAAAMELVFDAKRYPYPYAANQEEVQNEVDALVARVAELWHTPGSALLAQDPALKSLQEEASALGSELESLGAPVVLNPVAARVHEKLDLKTFANDNRAREGLERAHEIENYNAALAEAMSEGERECLKATNEYRVMMGLHPVMADEKLVACARGHSQEMKELNYFSHQSPTAGRESPGSRAKLSGWGSSVSENIARGQPSGSDAVQSWRHSSGHHRNILGKQWTHLGVGRSDAGNFWTQNFASGSLKPRAPKEGSDKKDGSMDNGEPGPGGRPEGGRGDGKPNPPAPRR